MEIAIISDIHGNYAALKKVLKEIDAMGITKLFCLGDIVGYYYEPDKIIDSLKLYDVEYVKGNHEELLELSMENQDEFQKVKKKYGSGIDAAMKGLSSDQINRLISLPRKKDVLVGGVKMLLWHGAPIGNPYVYPDTPDTIKDEILCTQADVVFLGHSHYAFIYKKNNKFLINPGSVGQNRLKGGFASWAVFNTKKKECQLKETKYDVQSVLTQIHRKDPGNVYLKNVLKRVNPL